MKKIFFFLFLYLLPGFLFSDILKFQDGKTIDNVKVSFQKDFIEIHYENGKKEVRKKASLKNIRIKLQAVNWNVDKVKEERKKKQLVNLLKEKKRRKEIAEKLKEKKEDEEEVKNVEDRKKGIENELADLEEQRELNFPLSPKIIEERKMHDALMKERVRLQYTEGLLSYSGGQALYSEIMEKNNDRFYIKNQFGLFYFTSKDLGEEIIIESDNGKEEIPLSKMLAVKEEKYIDGFIYLIGGEKFRGKILKNLGDKVVIARDKQEIKLAANDVLFPKIPKDKESPAIINMKIGDNGKFLFTNGQTVEGKLIRLSKNYMFIETSYGVLEMELSGIVSANKEEDSK